MRLLIIIGGVIWVAGAVQLVRDIITFVGSGQFVFQPLGEVWFHLHVGSLNLTQAIIERYIWPPIWDPIIVTVLQWPASLLGLVLGTVLFLVGRANYPGPRSA